MYASTLAHTVDCTEFILGIYADIIVLSLYELIYICSMYMAFVGIFVSSTHLAIMYEETTAVGCIGRYVQKFWLYMAI